MCLKCGARGMYWPHKIAPFLRPGPRGAGGWFADLRALRGRKR